MKAVRRFFLGVYYSLPIQLLLNQIRTHKAILLFWLFLFLVITESLLTELGGPYIFLAPMYMNHISFWSTFIMGICLGFFTLAYQMTCYILDGYRFPFLMLQKRPFMKFALNNSLIPLLFWSTYLICYLRFEVKDPSIPLHSILLHLVGLIFGGVFVFLLGTLYFIFTNEDVFKLFDEKFIRQLRNPRAVVRRARQEIEYSIRIDYFITGHLHIRAVDKSIKGDFRSLIRILNQNHNNALLVQGFFVLLLILIGLFQDWPPFQLPAGGSFLILFSLALMSLGAITFWFRRLGLLTLVVVLATVYFLNNFGPFIGDNYAYGLDYKQAPVTYDLEAVKAAINVTNYKEDYIETEKILNKWVQNTTSSPTSSQKPKMILLCVSGGGLRSAVWTMKCLQHVDKELQGKLHENIRLIVGASGGMMGSAYFRELMIKQQQDSSINLYDQKYLDNISKDLLNRIIFNVIGNIFIPNPKFKIGENEYYADRGYAFESQLIDNTQCFYNKTLEDYKQPEQEAKIPMMVFTPAIVNDGRRLFISSQKVSYFIRPLKFSSAYSNEIPGIEFNHFFVNHHPEKMRFTTAIRMSATFPYVLPFVELPSDPTMEVMDAGIIDNYGVNLAVKFMYVYREWIKKNTSGVIILQIRDSQREKPILLNPKKTLLNKILNVFGGTYKSLAESKDFMNDEVIEYARTWLGDQFEMMELQYIPSKRFEHASLNFRLTNREKEDILQSIYNPENQRTVDRLKELLQVTPAK